MKRLLAGSIVFLVSLVGVFAYTPSADLVERMDTVVDKFENIIDDRGESYRVGVVSVLQEYKTRYEGNERVLYILDYLSENLSGDDTDNSTTSTVTQASGDYTASYSINSEAYGTQVDVVLSGDMRTITSNAIANHEVGEFPTAGNPNTISEQDKQWELDASPTYTGDASWARESGVAYNGVKYELETAERVSCESGEEYKIEAIQDMVSLGLDFNNAHVQPTGEYHYHGVSDLLMDTLEGDDVVHVGYANDGFPLYYSKQGTYTPSYQLADGERTGTSCMYRDASVTVDGTIPDGTYGSDWEYAEGLGNLDSCNGISINGEYGYFITESFPYGPRCLNGEVSSQKGGQSGPPSGGRNGGQVGPSRR